MATRSNPRSRRLRRPHGNAVTTPASVGGKAAKAGATVDLLSVNPVPATIPYPPMPVAGLQVLDEDTVATHGSAIEAALAQMTPYLEVDRALPPGPEAWPVNEWLALPGDQITVVLAHLISTHINGGEPLDRAWWELALHLVREKLDDAKRREVAWTVALDSLVTSGLWEHARHLDAPMGATEAHIDALWLARSLPRLRDQMRPIAEWCRHLPPAQARCIVTPLSSTLTPEVWEALGEAAGAENIGPSCTLMQILWNHAGGILGALRNPNVSMKDRTAIAGRLADMWRKKVPCPGEQLAHDHTLPLLLAAGREGAQLDAVTWKALRRARGTGTPEDQYVLRRLLAMDPAMMPGSLLSNPADDPVNFLTVLWKLSDAGNKGFVAELLATWRSRETSLDRIVSLALNVRGVGRLQSNELHRIWAITPRHTAAHEMALALHPAADEGLWNAMLASQRHKLHQGTLNILGSLPQVRRDPALRALLLARGRRAPFAWLVREASADFLQCWAGLVRQSADAAERLIGQAVLPPGTVMDRKALATVLRCPRPAVRAAAFVWMGQLADGPEEEAAVGNLSEALV